VEVEPGDRLPELWELAARRGAGGTGASGGTEGSRLSERTGAEVGAS
jgi:hypothetical protein